MAKRHTQKPDDNRANLSFWQSPWLAAELGMLSSEDRQRLAVVLIGHQSEGKGSTGA